MTARTRKDRLAGGLLGLLVGDALGVPYEVHEPEEIPSHEQIEFTPPSGY
jgi:ADP-ribosylglycohydrolase